MNKFRTPGNIEKIIILFALLYAILSKNPLLSICAVITPFVLMKLTWRTSESPLLYVAMLLQWLAITIKVFYANSNDLLFTSEELHRYPLQIENAFYYALLGLIALALGIHLMIRKFELKTNDDILQDALKYDGKKLTTLYVILAIAYPILNKLAFSFGGLQQPISKAIEFKWTIFFIFMLYALQSKKYKAFLTIFIVEILFSFTGFFSGFKDYLLLLGIGSVVAYGASFKPIHLIPSFLLIFTSFYILVAWQNIKPVYREYLNAGEATQTSVRSTDESLGFLYELGSNIDEEGIKDGFEQTIERLSYIDFLSAVMTNVPENVDHTDGSLWTGAIGRVLMPRILFPNKEAIDDSEKTVLYTGQAYAGAEQGTSISLGYFAESYVDFGAIGMVIILFIFGLLIGWIYQYVLTQSPDILIGTALVIPLFFIIQSYETALDKIFGALLMYFIMYLLIKRFALGSILNYIKH